MRAESISLLDGGTEAYPRMLTAIDLARDSIHFEVYGFVHSTVGKQFIDGLGSAAGRGVMVHVSIDGWGSARSGLAVAAALRGVGCYVQIHNRLRSLFGGRFGRNHRKVLLIDDEVAFIGGINIGDENIDVGLHLAWADLSLEIHGPQCVRLGEMLRRQPVRAIESAVQIHLSGLGGGWRLRRVCVRAFARARHRIDIAHGYFLPEGRVLRAIEAAAGRGVQVRLLLAGRSDVLFARTATRSLYRRLHAAGVAIYEWNESVLHAKLVTIDGVRLLAGSFNLDRFSLANLETLVEVDDPAIAAQGEAWIDAHVNHSRRVSSMESQTRLQRWFFEPFGRLAARLADAISRVLSRGSRTQRGSPPR